ncbi:MAG: sodium-translocating pyrophosphatase [Acidobacteria bacterium]|nr:sodium-translocating pyrophosphatase [Acidobacteriota bacterium]
MNYFLLVIISGVAALISAFLFARRVNREGFGTPEVAEITGAIREGAVAFLSREYKSLVLFIIVVFFALFFFIEKLTAVSFIAGAFSSALAGYIGMMMATSANGRTANAARGSFSRAVSIAFAGGAVLGMSVVGLGILGLTIGYLLLLHHFGGDVVKAVEVVTGFSFGASSIALFARVGGGIYTKAADVGADLVGKVESGIPEDDPRNPAVIADNVGDCVGDTAGMGADLFESYIASTIGAMTIGALLYGAKGVMLPLAVRGIGIIASIIGALFVRTKEGKKLDFQEQTALTRRAMNKGTIITWTISAIAIYFLIKAIIGDIGIFYAVLAGLIAGLIISWLTEHYTSDKGAPVQEIANSAVKGVGGTILSGISSGMESASISLVLIAGAIFLAYHFGGLYGIPMAAVGLLAPLGMVLAIDGYGPITDNAAGIAEMAGLGAETRARTEALDSVGNTTAAVNKGFAIGTAVFTAFALFSAYAQVIKLKMIDLLSTPVLAGFLIGGMLTLLFCALTLKAVGKAAYRMVNEVRRQFREIAGLMEGKAKPDYKRCVDISTRGALREMVLPSLLAVAAPLVIGFTLGARAVGGLLVGSILTASLFAIMMANSGASWDNAKKFIEAGHLGGKGSPAHKTAVIGDTLGDPFKDTSGPSLNILIKVMSIVSLIFAPIFIKMGLL